MRLALILSVLTIGSSFAQTCEAEIRGDTSEAALAAPATGLHAAELLKRAVDVLEPVLPQLYSLPVSFSVMPSEPYYTTARFLKERGLLPSAWEAESLSPEVWEEMLNAFRDWFELPAVTVGQTPTKGELLADLTEVAGLVAPRLRPVALVSPSAADQDRPAFWAVALSDSVYPRIVVFRPPNEGVGGGVPAALDSLATCAYAPQRFLAAGETTARNLFRENNRTDMYIVGSAPELLPGFEKIDKGLELDYLTFQHEATQDWTSYSVVFAGKGLGPVGVMRLLPRIRTNMSPQELINFVQAN